MSSEDICFCANSNCPDMKCDRNMKHIKLAIPHSFSIFQECYKWKEANAVWFTDQLNKKK